MIYPLPKNWRDLQNKSSVIFSQCGFSSETEKNISLVRGNVKIDVFAEDKNQMPELTYLCECKFWESNIPQEKIHAFRTVMSDYGANIGFVIAKKGFQKGAYDAVKNTNVKLVNWEEFQEIFLNKWFESMKKEIYRDCYPIRDYTDSWDSKMNKKANKFNENEYKSFKGLQKKYFPISALLGSVYFGSINDLNSPQKIVITKGDSLIVSEVKYLSEFFKVLREECIKGIMEFDELFGEEIRFIPPIKGG